MVPTAFDEENCVLGPPAGMTTEECDAISACLGTLPSGKTCVISCWKPTHAELQEIQRTGRVWLIVWGEGHPPVAISGHNPFAEGITGQ